MTYWIDAILPLFGAIVSTALPTLTVRRRTVSGVAGKSRPRFFHNSLGHVMRIAKNPAQLSGPARTAGSVTSVLAGPITRRWRVAAHQTQKSLALMFSRAAYYSSSEVAVALSLTAASLSSIARSYRTQATS